MFQLIFHPSQDRFSKFQTSRVSGKKTVHGCLPTRMLIYCLFRPSVQRLQTWIPFWYSPTHLQHTVQQTFLDGIFKPISDKILSHLQMGSLSPFPQLCFDGCKFMGTLVSNHLLPWVANGKLANLTLQVQEDWTGATVVPQNLPSHFSQDFSSQDLLDSRQD